MESITNTVKKNVIDHRGEWLRNKVKEMEWPIGPLAKDLGVHRLTLYRWFDTKDLQLSKIREVCEVIKVDMYAFFPEALSTKNIHDVVNSAENKEVFEKYHSLLERYQVVMDELLHMRAENEQLKTKLKTFDRD